MGSCMYVLTGAGLDLNIGIASLQTDLAKVLRGHRHPRLNPIQSRWDVVQLLRADHFGVSPAFDTPESAGLWSSAGSTQPMSASMQHGQPCMLGETGVGVRLGVCHCQALNSMSSPQLAAHRRAGHLKFSLGVLAPAGWGSSAASVAAAA